MESTRTPNRRRTVGVIVSISLILAILASVTYAFVLPSQHKSNEFSGTGVRHEATLNERFTERENWLEGEIVSKEIDVTNTGNDPANYGSVYVKVQLREFMETSTMVYTYWKADGKSSVARNSMNDAALFMTTSTTEGDSSAVFVHVAAETEATMTAAEARAALTVKYPELVAQGVNFRTRTLDPVYTKDDVSGVSGWYVVTQAGDPNGQYGRYMVAKIEGTDKKIVGTPGIARAAVPNYGVHGTNGECSYDVHKWSLNNTYTAPTKNYREFINWNWYPNNIILLSTWDGKPVDKWIVDDTATGNGWVYWGRELLVGETTKRLLDSVTLTKHPGGNFYYTIHSEMDSVSKEGLDSWTNVPTKIKEAYRVQSAANITSPAGKVLIPGATIEYDVAGDGKLSNSRIDLGNDFILEAGADGLYGTNDDFVKFGEYLQDATSGTMVRNAPNSDFTKSALKWKLLDIVDGQALLITEDIIDAVLRETSGDAKAWADSNLNLWLNSKAGGVDRGTAANNNQTAGGFLNTAFTSTQRGKIIGKATTAADDGIVITRMGPNNGVAAPGLDNSLDNGWAKFDPTPKSLVTATDKVFALSNSEVWKYFGVSTLATNANVNGQPVEHYTMGMAKTTQYAQSKAVHASPNPVFGVPDTIWNGNGMWWTRTAGRTAEYASSVSIPGTVSAAYLATNSNIGARPAIWVKTK